MAMVVKNTDLQDEIQHISVFGYDPSAVMLD